MTELKIYKCDRCFNNFEVPTDSDVDGTTISSYGESKRHDLCGDCMMVVNYTMMSKYREEFNQLA